MESDVPRSGCGGCHAPDKPEPARPSPGITRMFLMKPQFLSSPRVLLLILSFLVSFGCTHDMEYKPKYLGTPVFDQVHKFDGKCAIYTTSRDDSYVFQGYPSSVYGSAETLKIPLGLITKNAAVRVFDAVCDEVSTVDSLDGRDYDVAIYPSPIGFEYFFAERGFLRLVITPQVVIYLQITAFNSDQDVVFEKSYNSGVVNGKNIYIPMTGWENVNAVAHMTIAELMSTAAEEIVVVLKEKTRPLPGH